MNFRTFCLLLLLANVAMFGWLFNQNLYSPPERPATALPAIAAGVPALRLLSELSEPLSKRDQPGKTLNPVNSREAEATTPPAERAATPAPPPAAEKTMDTNTAADTIAIPAAPETVAPAPAPETSVQETAAPVTGTTQEAPPSMPACYTLGPFADEVQRAQARESLTARLQRAHERDEVPEPGRQWVYLGPYPSSAVAEKEVAALKGKGVEDMFVVKQGVNKNTISLGLFKEKISVTERIRELKALGYEAHVEARYETPPRYWLDVAVDAAQVSPSALQEALPGSAQTKAVDCGKIAEAGTAQ